MSAWYIERPYEILLDVDRPKARRLSIINGRLEAAHEARRLMTTGVWMFPSGGEGHVHIYVRLAWGLPDVGRVAWALWLYDDPIRRAYGLLRRGDEYGEPRFLLIEPYRLPDYPRQPDHECSCEEKHLDMSLCPVGRHVRPYASPLQHVKPREKRAWPRWDHFGQVWPEAGREGVRDVPTSVPLPA